MRFTAVFLVLFALVLQGCGLIRSKDPETVYENCLALVEANRFDEAQDVLDHLSRLRSPTPLDHGLKARILMSKQKDQEAVEELAVIPDSHPLAVWARLRQGQLLRKNDYLKQAETAFQSVIKLDPRSVEARRELVYVLGLQLRRAELNRNFLELSRLTTLNAKEVWVWCMVRDLVWWTPEEQVPILERATQSDSSDDWSRLALAEVLRRTGKPELAESQLEKLPSDWPNGIVKKAEIELEQGRIEETTKLLETLPETEPCASTLRGRLALAAGDSNKAITFFEIADRADPGRRDILGDLGRAWSLNGDPEKGREFATVAGKVDELNNLLLKSETTIHLSDVAQWRDLANACLKAGRANEARAWLSLIIQKNPLDSEAQKSIFQIDRQNTD